MIWQEVNRCLRTLLHVHRLSEAVDICRRKWHLGSRIQSACHQSEQPTCCSHHSKPDSEPSYLHKKYGTSPPTLSEGPESASSSQPQASSSTYIRREPARIGSTDFLLVWCLSCYPNNGIKTPKETKSTDSNEGILPWSHFFIHYQTRPGQTAVKWLSLLLSDSWWKGLLLPLGWLTGSSR